MAELATAPQSLDASPLARVRLLERYVRAGGAAYTADELIAVPLAEAEFLVRQGVAVLSPFAADAKSVSAPPRDKMLQSPEQKK